MAEWLSVAEGRERGGLRLVITSGVPGPWGEAAKGVFAAKGVAYQRVAQAGGQPNDELRAWTGFDNAPQAVLDDERARIGWVEILYLAERLAPEPSLVPEDARERVQMFGLSNELCGEMGLGWCRRLQLLAPMYALPADQAGPVRAIAERLGNKYGYDEEAAKRAPERVRQILQLFSDQYAAQRELGSRYLLGERLSALDIYWAAFAALVEPLPHALCPMPESMRANYEIAHDDPMRAACDPALLEHRDFVYREHIGLPIEL